MTSDFFSASSCATIDAGAIDIAVVVPTLNERPNIERLLEAILTSDERLSVIVVDDGSRDGTAQFVREQSQRNPRVRLIDRGRKKGYASAVQDGMRLALERGASRIVQMDADFSHDPKYLPALLNKSESKNLDLTIGSRYVPGGGTRNWGLDRRILSGGANALARAVLRLPVRDCTSGFRCWKPGLIERAGILDVRVEGYAFLFLTTDACRRVGARMGEVPILFVDRQHGKSKMSRKIVLEAVQVLARLWWKRVTRK
jgi:dolichol-phosphate mannosyltransferase